MLDAIDARAQRGLDAPGADRVNRDFPAVPVGLVHRRPELLVREVLAPGVVPGRHDATGGGQLDPVGPVLYLLADRLSHSGGAVHHDVWDLDGEVRRQGVEVTVT